MFSPNNFPPDKPSTAKAAIAKLSEVERTSKSERERMRAEVEQDELLDVGMIGKSWVFHRKIKIFNKTL